MYVTFILFSNCIIKTCPLSRNGSTESGVEKEKRIVEREKQE